MDPNVDAQARIVYIDVGAFPKAIAKLIDNGILGFQGYVFGMLEKAGGDDGIYRQSIFYCHEFGPVHLSNLLV